MHPSFKSIRRILWLLPLALLLNFSWGVPGASAQSGLYAGTAHFNVANTQLNNQGKFVTKKQEVVGELHFYLVESGSQLVPGLIPGTSYFMVFIDVHRNLMFGIDKLVNLTSQYGLIRGVGTGTFFHQDNGVAHANINGPVYLHFSGTVVMDHRTGNIGNIGKIKITSKAAGGIFYIDPNDANNNVVYTWKASPKLFVTHRSSVSSGIIGSTSGGGAKASLR